MSRWQIGLVLLTMPFWLGILIAVWMRNPYLILIPCGIILVGLLTMIAFLVFAADIRSYDDWDLVIRSVLHRLGFSVAPPKSLGEDVDLNHTHHHHHEQVEENH